MHCDSSQKRNTIFRLGLGVKIIMMCIAMDT